jgi:integrase
LALRVQDVDFLRRTARVEWQIAPAPRRGQTPRRRGHAGPWRSPRSSLTAWPRISLACPPAADGTLFTTRTGAPYRHDYYGTTIFSAAVSRAGLPDGTTSHDLRHHYASVLLAGGESVVAVAERLGHENATLVLKTYGHLMPDSEDRTRRVVDEAWGAITVPSLSAASPRPGPMGVI